MEHQPLITVYVIILYNEGIENFILLPLDEMSDHSKITTIFKSSIPIHNESQDKYNWNQLKTGFKWSSENKKAFADTIQNLYLKSG